MKTVMTVLAIAALCICAWAADNAAVGARPTANHQAPISGPQSLDAISIPQMLSYQGKLTDTMGVPVMDTTYSVTFRLYTVPSGGSSFWNETQTAVRTRGGLFATLLGSVAPIESVPSSGNLYLGMAVAGGAEMSPRLRLVGSAYSYLAGKSANADLLQGRDTTTFSRSTHNHDATYVNEGQANAVTTTMVVDTAVTMAKIARAGATTGQVVKWSGSAWAPGPDNTGGGSGVTNVYQDTGITCVPNPITSTGNVKLDLAYGDGRYVNEAQSNSVTSAMITDGNVTAADIRDTTVNTAELKDAAVTAPKLNQMGASSGQVMKWTGSAWAPRNDSIGGGGGSGTVRKVVQATGIVCAPNPITDSGTVRFDSTWGDARFVNEGQANGVTAAMIRDTNVTMAKLQRAGATTGQAVVWTGSAWAPSAVTADNSDKVDGYHAGNSSGQVAVSNSTVCTNLNADYLDGSHASAFAPDSGSAHYIQKDPSSPQFGGFSVTGIGYAQQLAGKSASPGFAAIYGNGGTYADGVYGLCATTDFSGVTGSGGTTTTGVYGYANNASRFGVRASNSNASGTGIAASGNGLSGTYLTAGSGGAFIGTAYGAYSGATASTSTGIVGAGNNASFSTFPTGSGGAFTGLTCGGYGHATQATGGVCGFYGDVNTSSGFGLSGTNTNSSGTGVSGCGNNASPGFLTAGSGLAGTGTKFGVFGRATDTASCSGGYFDNGHGSYVYVAYYNSGTNYKVIGTGTVSTIMATREGRKTLFAPEMPEAYFEDCGEGQLAGGHCRVNLEKLFSDCITVNAQHPLKVFVQLEDDCKGVYVNKDATGFDVHELQGGKSSARFSWRVLAKWQGMENLRLPEAPRPQPTVTGERPVPVEGKTATATQPQPVPGLK